MGDVEDLSRLRAQIKDLQDKRQRVLGQLEASEERLRSLKDKCRKAKVDPDNLESDIQKLEVLRSRKLEELELAVSKMQNALSKYSEDL